MSNPSNNKHDNTTGTSETSGGKASGGGTLKSPLFWIAFALTLGAVISWLPLSIIAKRRFSTSNKPRIRIFQDMAAQPKYRPQATSPIFADGRAMRVPVTGTVSFGDVQEDDHYYRGYKLAESPQQQGKFEATYFKGFPQQVTIDESFIRRGQERFGIYCAPCHGVDGYGQGTIHLRALELQQTTWVPPTSMHTDTVRQREAGHLYNTITHGIRNMPAYGKQIPVKDRWAIVAYLRALQLSQNAPVSNVPVDKRPTLR
ncbi:MAG: cytochrome c [Phycisphaeraceae bacterium]|nr:cytochrome c [Phycisphaeraceae bacterium]